MVLRRCETFPRGTASVLNDHGPLWAMVSAGGLVELGWGPRNVPVPVPAQPHQGELPTLQEYGVTRLMLAKCSEGSVANALVPLHH